MTNTLANIARFHVTNETLIYAISTGIAMIPESLLAVLTITFVTGTNEMRRKKVLTRKLSALEALGGIDSICSDKTGTLTQGQMVTRKAWIPGYGVLTVEGSNDASDPTQGSVHFTDDAENMPSADEERQATIEKDRAIKFVEPDRPARQNRPSPSTTDEKLDSSGDVDMTPALDTFLQSSALCNIATVRFSDSEKKWQTTGDPTEIALQVFSTRFEKGKKNLEGAGWRQLAEYPFDSDVKRMSVIYSNDQTNERFIFSKGAVERLLDRCTSVGFGSDTQEMTDGLKESILTRMSSFADQGLRVLAIAHRTYPEELGNKDEVEREEIEKDLTLLGLAGLYDPPRLETKGAVRRKYCQCTISTP